jgi:hypothetical protein
MLSVLTPIFALLLMPLKALGPVIDLLMQGLFYVVKGIGMGVTWLWSGILGAWNAIMGGLASLMDTIISVITFGAVKSGGDFARAMMVDTTGLTSSFNQLNGATYDGTSALLNLAGAADSTAQSFADSLSNVPTGFKTALARFNAAAPQGQGMSWDPGAGALAAMGAGGGVTITGDVYVQAGTSSELLDALKAQAKRERFIKTGSPHASGGWPP